MDEHMDGQSGNHEHEMINMNDECNELEGCEEYESIGRDEFDIDVTKILSPCKNSLDDGTTNTETTSKEATSIPCIGMSFTSEDEAYMFYNSYARVNGFGIRKGNNYESKKRKCRIMRKFVCAKAGFKSMNDKREDGKEVKRRRAIREGCKACMVIKLKVSSVWVVDVFEDMHNHATIRTPSKVARLRSHKKSMPACKKLIDTFHGCGIGPSKISQVINDFNGVEGDLEVTPKDVGYHLSKSRKSNIGQECIGIINYFQEKRAKDDDFFFQVDIDSVTHQVRSVFWADGRSRQSYLNFGDVVVFDVTYRTNSFSMPFAPFTGVNHHKQSILFGCALLADETEQSFIWLFRTWLACMWNKMPISIITDQDLAMKNVIRKVFQNTRHQFCSWHLGRNALIHIGMLRSNEEFSSEYNAWVYGSKTIEEFEKTWESLKEKYKLQGTWLANMYEQRGHWVPSYLRDTFFAGMTSSQRSESINSFFDGFVSAQTPLHDFVRLYDKAIKFRRSTEESEDLVTMYTKPNMFSGHPMEVQAGKVYTRKIFDLFQEEFKRSTSLRADIVKQDGISFTYVVGKYDMNSRRHQVIFNDSDGVAATCSCKKFEYEGLLCKHILKVFHKVDLAEIPKKYILHRWTINARHEIIDNCQQGKNEESQFSVNGITSLMIWNFRSANLTITDLALSSFDAYKYVMPLLQDIAQKLREMNEMAGSNIQNVEKNILDPLPSQLINHIPQIVIRDPIVGKNKGRPKNPSRIPSSLEASKDRAKPRTCRKCGGQGHYVTTCQGQGQ